MKRIICFQMIRIRIFFFFVNLLINVEINDFQIEKKNGQLLDERLWPTLRSCSAYTVLMLFSVCARVVQCIYSDGGDGDDGVVGSGGPWSQGCDRVRDLIPSIELCVCVDKYVPYTQFENKAELGVSEDGTTVGGLYTL